MPENGSNFFKWLKDFQLEFDLNQLKKFSLYESVEYIIRSFSLIKDSNAYIQFFLDFVFETTQKTANSLNDFLEKWEQKKDKLSIVVPESDNAVQIMTIHKSKGLEFPVVIYPFANSDLQDTRNDNLWLDIHDENIPVAYVSASSKMLNWNEAASQKYQDLVHKNELDTLNVLYVACTRAAQQLYLLSNYNERPKKNTNVSDMLADFIKTTGMWNDGFIYEFGDSGQAINSKKTGNQSIEPAKYYSSSTQNQAVNIVTRSGSLWDSKQQDAIEKGEITHEILARINKAEDLTKAMEWAVNTGMIKKSSQEPISELILKIMEHPDLKQFYSPNSENLNEKELITINGKRLRPDRLNFHDGKVTVIDYKTGGFVDSHKMQVSEYASSLMEMGYEIEKCLLIYTNNPIIIKNV
nr:3'-5' exonuclease [Christiangramia lutea]